MIHRASSSAVPREEHHNKGPYLAPSQSNTLEGTWHIHTQERELEIIG